FSRRNLCESSHLLPQACLRRDRPQPARSSAPRKLVIPQKPLVLTDHLLAHAVPDWIQVGTLLQLRCPPLMCTSSTCEGNPHSRLVAVIQSFRLTSNLELPSRLYVDS